MSGGSSVEYIDIIAELVAAVADAGESDLIVVIISMLTVCVSNGVSVVALKRYFKFRNENRRLSVRISDQRDMLKRVDDIYEEMRIIRHDTKHYLALVSNLLDMDDAPEANRVVKTALEKKLLQINPARYIKSNLVNAILNEKNERCDKEGIKLDISITCNISEKYEFDISVVLANLLDNAIEAEIKSGGGRIYVNMSNYKGMYYITVQNHIVKSVLAENPELETTKKNKALHGLGIKSVKKQVENMDGVYRCFEEDGRFITSIALPLA
jgi:sensor histidine kinase regulating citrate/malate metabolism